MLVNLGFRLGFLTFLILIILVFSGAYFLYDKFTEGNSSLNIESKSEIVSNSKNNNDKSESTAESFLRNNRENFLKNKP